MPARTEQSLIDLAVKLYRAGKPRDEITAKTGLAWNTVAKHARDAGCRPRPGGPQGYTERTRARAVELYRAGEPLFKIEAATGAHKISILRWCKDAKEPRRRKIDAFSEAERAEAVRMFLDGEDTAMVAARTGACERSVLRWVREAGHETRRMNGLERTDKPRLDQAMRLYVAGATLLQIAAATGLDRGTLYRTARRRKIPLRPIGTAIRIDADEVQRRIRAGESYSKAAAELGCSKGGIAAALNRAARDRVRAQGARP